MQEIWKPIIGYENLYEVSNLGNVRSLGRICDYHLNGKTYKKVKKTHLLKLNLDGHGYCFVRLYNDMFPKGQQIKVHRLVALHFVENPNPEKFNIINHKDENPKNNIYTNLEWCDTAYNNAYGTRLERAIEKEKIPIEAIDADGNVVLKFESGNEAKRNGYQNAMLCCRGLYKTCGGYKWRYSN